MTSEDATFRALLREVARAPLVVEEPDLVGATLGPFEILERLGQGGMGVVYRARDRRLERDVAVKVVSPRLTGTEGHGRLLDEARSAARLNHPNIATVHEVARHDGVELVAMELAPGGTLRGQTLKGAALDRALGDIARALAHAHARGIVHRDLKPDNLARGDGGEVLVLDFGLALRRPGEVAGTPGYMPPEQEQGEESGPRADVYAFGRTAVELACGALPPVGEEARALDASRVPRARRALFLACLAQKPAERPLDGAALAAALERRGRSGFGLGLASIGAVAALAVIVPLVADRASPAPPSVASVPLEGDARARGRMRAAVESIYAADLDAAQRQLDVSGPESQAIALVLAALARDDDAFQEARVALSGADGWPGLIARVASSSHVETLTHQSPLDEALEAEVAGFLRDPDVGWFPRFLVVGIAPGGAEVRAARLEALIAEDPGPAVTWWLLTNTWMRADDGDRARAAIARGRAASPRNRVLARTEAEVLVSDDPKAALKVIEPLLRDAPADLVLRFLRIEAWEQLGQRERVLRELERLLDADNGFEPHFAARGALAISRSFTCRGESKAVRSIVDRAVDAYVEREAWAALATWLPRLWDEATLRLDDEEAARWARLIRLHRERHADLEATARLLDGEPPAASKAPEVERLSARLRYLADPSAAHEVELRAARVEHVVDLLVAESIPARREPLLRGLVSRAEDCAGRTLWWEHVCRVAVARAAAALKEPAALGRVWPSPIRTPLCSVAPRDAERRGEGEEPDRADPAEEEVR